MSLILEALRKSEAERRRGQAPGLFTPDRGMPTAVVQPRSRMALAIVVLMLMAAIAYGGWRSRHEAAGDDSSPTRLEPMPVESIQARQPVGPGANAPDNNMSPATNASPSIPSRQTTTASPPTPPAAAALPLVTTPTLPIPEPMPEASNTTEAPAITIAALSSERRSRLPALKLSMHVYDSDPAKRFAIIDGQRVTEGSSVGTATVRSIRRDGVLLELDGEDYLLPRP